MFIKTLKAKKNKSETEMEMVKIISSSYDISDKKYIEPILQCLKNNFLNFSISPDSFPCRGA